MWWDTLRCVPLLSDINLYTYHHHHHRHHIQMANNNHTKYETNINDNGSNIVYTTLLLPDFLSQVCCNSALGPSISTTTNRQQQQQEKRREENHHFVRLFVSYGGMSIIFRFVDSILFGCWSSSIVVWHPLWLHPPPTPRLWIKFKTNAPVCLLLFVLGCVVCGQQC